MSEESISGGALARADVVPVLGIPVRFTSDHRDVAAAFEATFGRWRALAGRADLLAGVGVVATIDAMPPVDRPGAATEATVVRHHPEGSALRIVAEGVDLVSDAAGRRITGRVLPQLLRHARLRREVLEAAVLWAIAHGDHDRQPIHAAAIVRDRAGLLITGRSGAGKSTLTYAAARAGLRVLSDESVFVQRQPMRVWGTPSVVRLGAASERFFPELRAMPPAGDATRGKRELSLAGLGAEPASPFVERVGICVLERAAVGAPTWSPLSAQDLERVLEGQLEEGFDLFRGRMGDLARALVERGAWRLSVGDRSDAWVPAIHRLLDEVGLQ